MACRLRFTLPPLLQDPDHPASAPRMVQVGPVVACCAVVALCLPHRHSRRTLSKNKLPRRSTWRSWAGGARFGAGAEANISLAASALLEAANIRVTLNFPAFLGSRAAHHSRPVLGPARDQPVTRLPGHPAPHVCPGPGEHVRLLWSRSWLFVAQTVAVVGQRSGRFTTGHPAPNVYWSPVSTQPLFQCSNSGCSRAQRKQRMFVARARCAGHVPPPCGFTACPAKRPALRPASRPAIFCTAGATNHARTDPAAPLVPGQLAPRVPGG